MWISPSHHFVSRIVGIGNIYANVTQYDPTIYLAYAADAIAAVLLALYTRQQARAELAQDGVVEAGISQLQAQKVFLVDPGADCVGGQIGQPFHEL